MQGIFSQIRYFERDLSTGFKKDNFILLSNRMSSVFHSHVIRMSLVCTRISSACQSYVLMFHPYVTHMYSYVIRTYVLVCHPYVNRMYLYVIRMSLVCTCMPSVCQSYVPVCHLYVTRMYSYVIRMSLACTLMSSVCHSYVVLP